MEHARRHAPTYHFRPSVLVQQVFSLLKQSPTGAIRRADLRRVAPGEVMDADVAHLMHHLTQAGYLRPGRPGEWRPGPALSDLIDEHEIYSNIGAEPLRAIIVDAYSGRTLARSGNIRIEGETLLMGGRLLEVVWRDRYRIGVRQGSQRAVDEPVRFHTAPFGVPLEVGQAVAAHLGFASGQLCLLHGDAGTWLFHFWGDIYGALLAAVLQAYFAWEDETLIVAAHNEFCVQLPFSLWQLPSWSPATVQRQLRRLMPRLEPLLELGRFHGLLPADMADRAVIQLCDLPRFERLYRTASITSPPTGLRTRLLELVSRQS